MTVSHETDGKEWEALEQIREVLDRVPNGSRVKAAFDGACELAEENIQTGAFASLKARAAFLDREARKWEESSKNNSSRLLNAQKQVAALEKALVEERNALADANQKNADLTAARNRLEEELEDMEKRAVSEKCATEIREIIRAQMASTKSAITAMAIVIAEEAGDPEGKAFLDARTAYGDGKGYLEVLEMIQAEIGD